MNHRLWVDLPLGSLYALAHTGQTRPMAMLTRIAEVRNQFSPRVDPLPPAHVYRGLGVFRFAAVENQRAIGVGVARSGEIGRKRAKPSKPAQGGADGTRHLPAGDSATSHRRATIMAHE